MVEIPRFKRVPRHLAVIPDGNRRWAEQRGMRKHEGYAQGVQPGLDLYDLCARLGISEMTAYGFTQDNTKRPAEQTVAFQRAVVDAVNRFRDREAELLVVGNSESPLFPEELKEFTTRQRFGRGTVRANLLVHYDWTWDLGQATRASGSNRRSLMESIGSADVSRIDLVIRWGGRRRLSGLLPIQSVYADIYVIDDLWPDFRPEHLFEALRWYQEQDPTLGG